MDSQVSRDPSRLTRPTKGWDERMKHIGPSGGGPVLQMFHRSDYPCVQYSCPWSWMFEVRIGDCLPNNWNECCFVAELFQLGDKACEVQQWKEASWTVLHTVTSTPDYAFICMSCAVLCTIYIHKIFILNKSLWLKFRVLNFLSLSKMVYWQQLVLLDFQ